MDKPNLEAYYAACHQAVTSDVMFQTFRSNRAICGVTDTNTREHGLECEQEIITNHRLLLPWLEDFRKIDEYGMPVLYRFPEVGLFNPTTLRHIVTMARIQERVDTPLNTIWEIGGSYGLLASLLLMTSPVERYFMYESKPVVNLSRLFLRRLRLNLPCGWGEPKSTPRPDEFPNPDIIISCYALSELDTDEQDWYIDNVLVHARAGFLVMNSCRNGYPRETMIARLQAKLDTKVYCEREIPLTHKDNYTLLWKHGGNDG